MKVNTMKQGLQPSERLVKLMEEAAKVAGSESKLAAMVEETRQNLSGWKHGKRACPVEAQILMAVIAKQDVDQVMKDALIERNAGTARGEKLVSALGKGLTTVGVVIVLALCGNDALASKLPTFHDVYYVKLLTA